MLAVEYRRTMLQSSVSGMWFVFVVTLGLTTAVSEKIQETMIGSCSSEGYEQCPGSSRCILSRWICDGENDCGDNSDEPAELCAKRVCPDGQLRCDSGQCVNKELFCIGFEACADGSLTPRNVCPSTICPFGHVLCPSTEKCIREVWLCDGDDDCGNGWDETPETCRDRPCPEGRIKCNSGMCIIQDRFCSGLAHCNDDTKITDVCPALSCESGWSKCPTVNKCISDSWFCDGDNDCADGSDEEPNYCAHLALQSSETGCLLKCISQFTPEFVNMDSFSQELLTTDLRLTCSELLETKACLTNSLDTECTEAERQALPVEFRKLLTIYIDAISYICAQHLDVFERNKVCLLGQRDNGQNLLTLIEKHCNSQDQESSDVCMSPDDFECSVAFVKNACGAEIAGHINALGNKIMTDVGCPAEIKRRENLLQLLQRKLA